MEPIEILSTRLVEIARGFVVFLPQIAVALILILVTWLFARLALGLSRRITSRMSLRPSLVDALSKLFSITIWIVGLLIAATVLFPDLTPGKMLAALGLGSIAIGLAFKDIFENFLAGLLILMREPMRIRDFVECEGVEGAVEKISIRDTYIRRTDGELVIMPNAMLYKNPVYIVTDRDLRRVSIDIGVAYKEDVATSRDVIEAALEGCRTIDRDKPVEVCAKQFGSSSIDFIVLWWTGSKPADERHSKNEVVTAIKKALDDAGIEIPFPYRTLTFDEPLEIKGEFPRADK